MASYIVKSKNIDFDISKSDVKASTKIGNFYSGDRFYTLLNEYLDLNLSRKSKILGFIVKYLFTTSNYKTNSSIANGKSKLMIFLDILGVLSLFGFLAMVIGVIGLSAGTMSSLPTSINGLAKFGEAFIKSIQGNALMLAFALIFLIIGISWLVMVLKIRKKNKPLSLKEYVAKKTEFVLKLRWMIKIKSKTFDKMLKKKDIKLCCLEKFEGQGGAGDRWLNIQLINLFASIFDDFNLIFQFNELSDDEYAELNEVMTYDFKKIELCKVIK